MKRLGLGLLNGRAICGMQVPLSNRETLSNKASKKCSKLMSLI